MFPICGGLSTVFVDKGNLAGLTQDVTRYVRACPTGPGMPLCLVPTVLNGRLELGLTYRIASRVRGQAEAMLDLVVARLEQLADTVDSEAEDSQHPENQPIQVAPAGGDPT